MVSQGSLAVRSPGTRRERLERERLFAATIEETREHGYGHSSVAEVAARAGLSRTCFEAHFAGVEQCLLQALHSLALQAHAHVISAYYGPRAGPFVDDSAIGAEHLLGRVLACLVPIAAATSGDGASVRAATSDGASAPATNGVAASAPATSGPNASSGPRNRFHHEPPKEL